MRVATLEIHKEEFSFSAGHFTIFSATEREYLHGHNYNVSVCFTFALGPNGLAFDYRFYKQKIQALCEQIDSHLLLPENSPYLRLQEEAEFLTAIFNHKKMHFPKEDVITLPLTNITLEELSYWFLQNLCAEESCLKEHGIHRMEVKVFNGPGQSGGAVWQV